MAEAIEHNTSEQVGSTPRECSREKTPAVEPSKIVPESRLSAPAKRRLSSHKKAKHSSKRSKSKRSKFSRTYSTSTSNDSSSSGSESSSESASERSAKSPSRQNESAFEEPEVSFDESIVTFTAEAAFKGLSKSARKSLLTDSPVPSYADLRPKKVDSFVKKYLKRNGTAFNPVMDLSQLPIIYFEHHHLNLL